MQVDETSEINKYVENLETLFISHGIEFHATPVIIFCGHYSSIRKAYVLLNKYYYSFDDPLKAVRFCFKIFKCIGIPFPSITKPIWSFIQKKIFHITLDRSISCVDKLVRKFIPHSKNQTQPNKKVKTN